MREFSTIGETQCKIQHADRAFRLHCLQHFDNAVDGQSVRNANDIEPDDIQLAVKHRKVRSRLENAFIKRNSEMPMPRVEHVKAIEFRAVERQMLEQNYRRRFRVGTSFASRFLPCPRKFAESVRIQISLLIDKNFFERFVFVFDANVENRFVILQKIVERGVDKRISERRTEPFTYIIFRHVEPPAVEQSLQFGNIVFIRRRLGGNRRQLQTHCGFVVLCALIDRIANCRNETLEKPGIFCFAEVSFRRFDCREIIIRVIRINQSRIMPIELQTVKEIAMQHFNSTPDLTGDRRSDPVQFFVRVAQLLAKILPEHFQNARVVRAHRRFVRRRYRLFQCQFVDGVLE